MNLSIPSSPSGRSAHNVERDRPFQLPTRIPLPARRVPILIPLPTNSHSVTGQADLDTHSVIGHFDFLCERTAHLKAGWGRGGSGLVPPRVPGAPLHRPPLYPMRSAVGSHCVPASLFPACGKARVCLTSGQSGPRCRLSYSRNLRAHGVCR